LIHFYKRNNKCSMEVDDVGMSTPPNNNQSESDVLLAYFTASCSRFQCKGKRSNLINWRRDERGVVETGELHRLECWQNPVRNLDVHTFVEIFAQKMYVHTADSFMPRENNTMEQDTDLPNLTTLIKEVKNYCGLLQVASTHQYGQTILFKQLNLEPEQMKEDLLISCAYLKHLSFVLYKSNVEHTQLLSLLISDLFLYQGRLKDFPHNHLASPVNSDYLHTWLEVRWALIVMVCHLGREPDEPLIETDIIHKNHLSWLEQIILATMFDLSEISRARLSEEKIGDKNAFDCVCVEEFWFCLIELLQTKNLDFCQLFDCLFTTEKREMDPVCNYLTYTAFTSKQLFWTLSGALIKLMNISGLGEQPCQVNLAKAVVKQLGMMLREEVVEDSLVPVMRATMPMVSCVGTGLLFLEKYWNFLSVLTRINSTFCAPSGNLKSYTIKPRTAVEWQRKVDELVAEVDGLGRGGALRLAMNSFDIFIDMVVATVKSWINNNKMKDVERLCTRLKQKLTKAKAGELNEWGVYHVVTLLAVVLKLSKQGSLLSLLRETLDEPVKRSGAPDSLHMLCFIGKLTGLLSCVGGEISLEEIGLSITEQMVKIVNQLVHQYQGDSAVRHRCEEYVKVYLEFLEELVAKTQFSQNEDCMFGTWIQTYLQVCSSTQMASILTSLGNVLTKLRSSCKPVDSYVVMQESLIAEKRFYSLAAKLGSTIYPALKNIINTLTCPKEAADLGYELLLVVMETTASGHNNQQLFQCSAPGIIQLFTSVNIRDYVRVYFLHRVSSDFQVLAKVVQCVERSQMKDEVLLVSVGVCCLTIQSNHEAYTKLKETWWNLSHHYGLENLTDKQKTEELALVYFNQIVNSSYRKVMFDVCNSVDSLTKAKIRPKHIYVVCGWMVQYYMHYLYRTDPPNTGFLQLVCVLLTPVFARATTWVPSSEELSGLKVCIPHFLGSMLAHPDFERGKILKRKANEVFSIYLNKFRPQDHPFSYLFSKSCLGKFSNQVLRESVQAFACDLLNERLKDSNTNIAMQAFQLTRHLLGNIDGSFYEPMTKEMIYTILEATLRDEPVQTESKAVVRKLLSGLLQQSASNLNLIKELDEKLLKFYREKISFQNLRFFVTLQVLVNVKPSILDSTWSQLQEIASRADKKRGISRSLTNKTQQLLNYITTAKGH